MRKKPYLIDGLIGNGNMLLTFTKDGVVQRLNWPRIDYVDQVNHQWAGISDKDTGKTLFFHESEFQHEQYYVEDSNILAVRHDTKGYQVNQTDFIHPEKDLWVRNFEITNTSKETRDLSFIYYSEAALDGQEKYQTTKFDLDTDTLSHYYRATAMAITSEEEIKGYQAGKAKEQAEANQFEGRMILNHPQGAFSINLGEVKAEETKKVTLYISLASTEKEALAANMEAKRVGYTKLKKQTLDYWMDLLSKRTQYEIEDSKVADIYKRSILTFHLLQNKQTGAFIAGPEVDDEYDYSGGYAYCWGRDAAFIASAVDAAGYHDSVSKFYRFMTSIQSADGSWDQRHYTDGVLAPTWGLQIDETGSILWGINQHYQLTKDESFRKDAWPSVKKGADFLAGFIDPETHLPLPSKDLWEKRDGEHLYSAAAVYGGLVGAAELAEKEHLDDLANRYKEKASKMKKAVLSIGWNDQEERFVRSIKLTVPAAQYEQERAAGRKVLERSNIKGVKEYTLWEDLTPDISLLGLSYPFGMIDVSDDKLKKTAQAIEETCTSKKVGGIERFPGDVYIGGNPWIISTLWLGIYKVKNNDYHAGSALFDWATKYANHLNLLPEQIDKETGEPAWVMPLTWSHAMYVLSIKEFSEKKLAEDIEESISVNK